MNFPCCAPLQFFNGCHWLDLILNSTSISYLICQLELPSTLAPTIFPPSLMVSISPSMPCPAILFATFSLSPLIIIHQPIIPNSCYCHFLSKKTQSNLLQQSLPMPVSSSIVGINASSGKTLFPELDFAYLSHLRGHSMCTLGSISAI